MKHPLTTLIFLLLLFAEASAQQHDAQWMLGPNTSIVDFRNDSIRLYTIDKTMGTTFTNANICSENGDLLYFTNGIYIADKNGDILKNGDSLNPCQYTIYYRDEGLNVPQGALFLPKPGSNRYYYLFHFSDDTIVYSQYRPARLYYSIIDKEGNGGLGEVVEKNVLFYYASIRDGGMTACKHVNGRDWWIVVGGLNSNRYFTFLLTPEGIKDTLSQYIGPKYSAPYDVAYSHFSIDGSKYVTVSYIGYVTVMDFDRCSGQFSNPVAIYSSATTDPIHFQATGGGSVEFSPNNRFIYVADRINMTQFDLQAANIQDSVEIYTSAQNDFYQIHMIQLAPNGKIYGSTWAGGSYYMHVINKPDELGDSCDFVYGGQPTLSDNSFNLPNMVNYKLGPLVASGCDTTTALTPALSQREREMRVQPNPADKYLYVEMPMQGDYELQLLNEMGQVIDHKQTRQVDIFDTENLPVGVYFVKATDKKKNYNVATQKIVVQH